MAPRVDITVELTGYFVRKTGGERQLRIRAPQDLGEAIPFLRRRLEEVYHITPTCIIMLNDRNTAFILRSHTAVELSDGDVLKVVPPV
jgi:molybdopterin converting factor small subunit